MKRFVSTSRLLLGNVNKEIKMQEIFDLMIFGEFLLILTTLSIANCNKKKLLIIFILQSPDANSLPSLCSPDSLPEDEITFMTLSMDDDLDMTIRAPYISMSESSELPLLISDDLMWGAQPDIKQALSVAKKNEETPIIASSQNINNNNNNNNNQQHQFFLADTFSKNSSIDSSLTSLLCNQFLQQHQQLQQQQSEQIALNRLHSETAVIRVIDDTIDNQPESGKIGLF